MNKKILIVGLGERGKTYVAYFLSKGCDVQGVCKTQKTSDLVSQKFNIVTNITMENVLLGSFDLIVLALLPDIQGKIALNILNQGYKKTLLIETPITWDNQELSQLKGFENVVFFLEEYYTLLARFMRKAQTKNISEINVELFINSSEDTFSREVALLHVRNNFIGLSHIPKINYKYIEHISEKIYYNISFSYQGTEIQYIFNDTKTFKIGGDIYNDVFNFDFVLPKILKHTSDLNNDYVIYHKDFQS